jgi:hypothetical protein
MKSIFYIVLLVFIISALGCNKEDTSVPVLTTQSISFVYENGKVIEPGDCIKPTINYAISITTKLKGLPIGKGIVVKYILNGVADQVTLTNGGTVIKKIKLINGLNVAKALETNQEATIFLDMQEFELVN